MFHNFLQEFDGRDPNRFFGGMPLDPNTRSPDTPLKLHLKDFLQTAITLVYQVNKDRGKMIGRKGVGICYFV